MEAIIRWLSEKGGEHVIEFINEQAAALQTAKQEADTARSDRDAAFNRAATALSKLRTTEDDLAALKGECEASKEQISKAVTYRVQLEGKIGALERENDQLAVCCDEIEVKANGLEKVNASLQSLLDKAEADIADGKKRIRDIADFVNARK